MMYLKTLGHPALLGADGSAGRLRKKDLALLVYLCVEGSSVHAHERLASLLWGPEEGARQSLTQALGRLGRVLPPGSLLMDTQGVSWGETLPCDAVVLLRGGLAPADVDDEFLLYADHFLEDFDPGPVADEFGRWVDRRREDLRSAALRLLERAGADAERERESWRAVGLAERAVQIDPRSKRARQRLTHALAALARRNAAQQQFHDFAEWLKREFGGESDPDTCISAGQPRAEPADPALPAVRVERIRSMYLTTLGHPILRAGDGSPVEALRAKDLALLIYLCVEGTPVHSRGHLAALLWGNNTEKDARHSLTQALGRLGRVLPPGMLVLKKGAVRWEGGLQCDAVTLCGGIEAAEVDGTFSLYGGDFLAGFDAGAGAENFAEWAERRRPMLRKAALRVLADAGDAAVAREDWRRAIGLGERAVEIDPVWEDGHRRLMQALAASAERNRALQHYEEFAAWLEENVGGVPDPETREMAEKLRGRGT